jgi:anti-sigma B factor antagonist
MEINIKEFRRCSVIEPVGRIDSQTAPQLAEAFQGLTEDGRFKIVLDMSQVGFISSAGLRVLINTQKTCKRWNRGEVVLANVPPVIYEALDLAGFDALFKMYDDVTEAVGSF